MATAAINSPGKQSGSQSVSQSEANLARPSSKHKHEKFIIFHLIKKCWNAKRKKILQRNSSKLSTQEVIKPEFQNLHNKMTLNAEYCIFIHQFTILSCTYHIHNCQFFMRFSCCFCVTSSVINLNIRHKRIPCCCHIKIFPFVLTINKCSCMSVCECGWSWIVNMVNML